MTLRVATFGTGYFSRYHYDAWNRIDGADVVAVCGHRNREQVDAFAAEFGIPQVFMDPAAMLDEVRPDLVDIITTPESHLELVRLVAERGIPMICQKPVAPTLEESIQLVEVAEKAGVPLIIHENWRFKPWFREAQRLLSAGAVGDPYSVTYMLRPGDGRGADAYLSRQPYFQKMPRFLIHETGIHTIDVFRFLMGEVTAVYADLRKRNPVITGEDSGIVTFDFSNGATGLFDGNRLAAIPADNPRLTMGEMLLEGSEGRIRLDGWGRLWHMPHGKAEIEHAYAWEDRGYSGDSVFNLQAHVVAHLRDGAPAENTGREYLKNLDVEEHVYRAAEEGRRLEIPA